jgi:hypothetical protein
VRRFLVLLAGLACLGAGLAAGYLGRRRFERAALPPVVSRPAALEAAHRAWERRDSDALARALDALGAAPPTTRDQLAEVALFHALAAGDERALDRVRVRFAGSPAAARAAWMLVERAPSPEVRAARRAAFADAYPDAWVLRERARDRR